MLESRFQKEIQSINESQCYVPEENGKVLIVLSPNKIRVLGVISQLTTFLKDRQ